MSIVLKGSRGPASHAIGPDRVAANGGTIWQEGPRSSLEQGLSIVMAPDLARYVDGDTVGKRTAGGNDGVIVGYDGAFLTVVDGGNDDSEVIQSVGGRLIMTPNDADNDYLCLCFQGGSNISTPPVSRLPFLPVANSKIRFGIRAKLSDATQSDLVVGLTPSDADLITSITDGIIIAKPDGSTQPIGTLTKNSSSTAAFLTDDAGVAIAAEDDTYFEAGFVVNGLTSVDFYWNGNRYHQATVTNLDDDEPLTISIQVQNGEAAAKTLTVERLVCRQDVV